MTWQILLGINLAAATIREFLNKKITNKIDPFVGLLYITFFAQIFFYLSFIITTHKLPRFDFLMSLSGILILIGFSAYFLALKISLSQSILFQSYSILVTIVLSAIFLGESKYFDIRTPMGLKVIFGIILAFLALWYLLHQKSKKEEKLEKRWFVYILITIIFMGIGSFISISFIHKYSPLEIFINQTNVTLPFFLLLTLLKKRRLAISKRMLLMTFFNAIVSTIAVIAFYQALLLTPVAKFYPLQQLLLVVLTMFTGVIFFKEAHFFSGKKLLGMLLGFIGMVLLIMS